MIARTSSVLEAEVDLIGSREHRLDAGAGECHSRMSPKLLDFAKMEQEAEKRR